MKTLTLFSFLLIVSFNLFSQDTLQVIAYNSGDQMFIRKKPLIDSGEIYTLNSRDTVQFIEYNGGDYCKVKKDKTIGYLNIIFLQNDENAVNKINELRLGGEKLVYTSLPKTDKSKPNYYNSQSSSYSGGSYYTGSSRTSSSHSIKTGPRGGRYYINKNGNKTYVKRK